MSADDECLPCNVQVKAKRETERGGGEGGGGGGWMVIQLVGWVGGEK